MVFGSAWGGNDELPMGIGDICCRASGARNGDAVEKEVAVAVGGVGVVWLVVIVGEGDADCDLSSGESEGHSEESGFESLDVELLEVLSVDLDQSTSGSDGGGGGSKFYF